jgi:hypothetical protein
MGVRESGMVCADALRTTSGRIVRSHQPPPREFDTFRATDRNTRSWVVRKRTPLTTFAFGIAQLDLFGMGRKGADLIRVFG